MSQARSFDQGSRIKDGGKEVEEEKGGEQEEVGREQGAPQVPVVRERLGFHAKGCAQPGQERDKEKTIFWVVTVILCRDNSDDGVGDEEDGGGDEGVVLQEAGDQGVADNSHHRVGKDEDDAFDHGAETALLLMLGCDLVFRHSFGQRDDRDQEAKHLQADIVFLVAKHKDNVEAWN